MRTTFASINLTYFKSVADTTENIFHGNLAIFEVQLHRVRALDAHLLLRRTVTDAAELSLDDERRHLILRLTGLVVHGWHLREYREDLSDATVRNPDFRAVQHVVLAVRGQLRFGFDRRCIAAGFNTEVGRLSTTLSVRLLPEGSVSANAAMCSPVANFSRYLCFCASEPNNRMPLKPID